MSQVIVPPAEEYEDRVGAFWDDIQWTPHKGGGCTLESHLTPVGYKKWETDGRVQAQWYDGVRFASGGFAYHLRSHECSMSRVLIDTQGAGI